MEMKDIIKMDQADQKKAMTQVFTEMMKKSENDQVNDMHSMILEVQKYATDNEYVNLCKVNLSIVSTLPEATIKTILKERLASQNMLKGKAKERDSKNLMQAINESPNKDAILSLLKTL